MFRTIFLTIALLTVAAPAQAEPFWWMDWTQYSPRDGCKAVSHQSVYSTHASVAKSSPKNDIALVEFNDGSTTIIRMTDVGPNVGHMTDIFVSDYGYCLAMFYAYREDDIRFKKGMPFQFAGND